MRRQRLLRHVTLAAALGCSFIFAGCAKIQGAGTNLAIGVLEDKVVPPQLQIGDVNLACTFATGNVPLISSGTRAFYGDPSLIETLLYTSSAACSEAEAVGEELRYLRAQREKRVDEATDARINQKRLLERTARRQLFAFQQMVTKLESKLNFKYGETCPKFTRDFDELAYLLGTVAGLQAVINDIAAQQAVGVPTDIAPKGDRAMKCLSNAKWWGAPQAARAVVWNILPGGADGKDVWGTFNLSMAQGERAGVRLPHVMYALAALSKDDYPRFRDSVRRFSNVKEFRPSKDYRLIDEISLQTIQNLSDRYWTENTGSRTPIGGLGKFWDDKSASIPTVDVDDLLK